MVEEANRHEAELNERALEGVSGGRDANFKEMDRAASVICQHCLADMECVCDGGGRVALREYMIANGKISFHRKCPYCKPRP